MMKYSDSEKSNVDWKRLEEITNPEFVSSMKALYSIYDAELVEWFANLYDPKVGGFYYSNSARDNEKTVWKQEEYTLLPDAESTCQTLGFISSSGIAKGKSYIEFLPSAVSKKIGEFVYSLQDEDGFFYHPQWGKNIGLSRRARDFNWSLNMLRAFGVEAKYPTLVGGKKEAYSAVAFPEHLSSAEKFDEYLKSFDMENCAYSAGNTLASQFPQIKAAGFADRLFEFLNSYQRPDTGLWHPTVDYSAINGLMKISGIYSSAGLVLPHAREAIFSAISVIESEQPIRYVVDIWNIWIAITNILKMLRKAGGEDGNRLADEVVHELRRKSSNAIRITKEKMLPLKKGDFAYSYCLDFPAPTSQGVPVCIPELAEGDVNATVIATVYMVDAVYSAMELSEYKVSLFGEEEGKMFINILNEKIKNI